MIWYKKLGFHNNPFSIKPAAFSDEMVAYDLDYIFDKVENSEMLFVEGQYGTGKTTILKNVINKFHGKNKIIYFSFNSGRIFNLPMLLDGANSFLRKLSGIKVRNIILLLDEVHMMNKTDASNVLKYYQSGVIQSVVFVSHQYDIVNFPDDIKLYLADNVVRTVALNQSEAIKLIKERIGDINLFTNKILTNIFDLADKNPRRYLAFCEDIARYAVEMDDYKVTEFHVESVLKDLIKPVKKVASSKTELKQNEIDKIEIKISEPVDLEESQVVETSIIEETQNKQGLSGDVNSNRISSESRIKKYKVNKLIDGKKDPLGTVEASKEIVSIEEEKIKVEEEPILQKQDTIEIKKNSNIDAEEIPEYKVFVFDD